MSNFAFNMGLMALAVVAGLFYLLHVRMRADAKAAEVCDPQLQTVVNFFNESLHELLLSVTRKIEDHFENEYGDGDDLFIDEYKRHLKIVTDFSGWVCQVSAPPGWPHHVTGFWPAKEDDFYSNRIVTVATGPSTHKEYVIPFVNLAYLVDRLTDMNAYNEKLVTMIKRSE